MSLKDLDPKNVVEIIRKEGIAIFPALISGDQLNRIMGDYENIQAKPEFKIELPFDCPGQASKVSGKDIFAFESVRDFFFGSQLEQITHYFWQDLLKDTPDRLARLQHCQDFYVMRDEVGTKSYANDLHVDVVHQLKFYLYLTDTDRKNGAFEYVPGSHKWTEEKRLAHPEKFNFEDRQFTRNLPASYGDPIALEAPAGTLFIFDTDLFHRAGKMEQGNRKIIRGHSRPL